MRPLPFTLNQALRCLSILVLWGVLLLDSRRHSRAGFEPMLLTLIGVTAGVYCLLRSWRPSLSFSALLAGLIVALGVAVWLFVRTLR